jgi:hypothetical protein
MQPIARASPVTAAAGLIRSVAGGGPVASPLFHLTLWVLALAVVPGMLAVRRWQSSP